MHRRILFICSLIITLVIAGCTRDLTDTEYLADAKALQKANKDNEAIIQLKNAISKNPGNLEARWLLGNLYVQTGQGASAEKELEFALNNGMSLEEVAIPLYKALLQQNKYEELLESKIPSSVSDPDQEAEISVLLGSAHFGLGQYFEAESKYQAALKLNPKSPGALVGIALLEIQDQKFADATNTLQGVLAIDERSVAAWGLLGDIARQHSNPEEAERAYSKAIEYSPAGSSDALFKRALVRINLGKLEEASGDIANLRMDPQAKVLADYAQGIVNFQKKDYKLAQQSFEQVLADYKDYKDAAFYLGATHFLQDHWEQASQYLRIYLNAVPSDIKAGKLLAAVQIRQGELQSAEKTLNNLFEQSPGDSELALMLGRTLLAQGEPEKAMEYFNRLIEANPGSANTEALIGYSLLLSNQQSLGETKLKNAMELDPNIQQAGAVLIESYLNNQKFDDALGIAEKMRENQPENTLPYNLLAIIYLSRNDQASGRKMLEQVLELKPDDSMAIYNLAVLERNSGNFEKAEALFEQFLQKNKQHSGAWIALAELHARSGDTKQVIESLEQAITANPKALTPYVALARYYLAINQLENARETVSLASKSHPSDPNLQLLVAEIDLSSGKYAESASSLEKLAKTMPKNAQLEYLLGRAYNTPDTMDAAEEHFEKAIALNPKFVSAKVALVGVLTLNKKQSEADILMDELLKAQPNNPEVLGMQGWLAIYNKNPAGAVNAYSELFKSNPSRENMSNLALAQISSGLTDQGFATVDKWLDEHPGDLAVLERFSSTSLLLHDDARALKYLTVLNELQPDNVSILNNMAWLLRKKDPSKALSYSTRAFELASDQPAVMDTLGVLLLASGDTKKALDLLQRANNLIPNNPSIQYHLAQGYTKNGDKEKALTILKALLAEKRQFSEQAEAQALFDQLSGAG
jgi:putative PEP-CTERM system TPR-repeat lipoprotein